ncbi:MAG: ComF family protein [Lachnospiraceae bacterium]|nr:ComF family protein [Lachnospiraceae bacterium]
MRSGAAGAGSFLLDLLYPRRCPVCHEAAPFGKDICPECRKKLPLYTGKRCVKCGKPVRPYESRCEDCKKNPHFYTRGVGVYIYNELMRESIAYMKYKGRKEYGEVLGRLAFEDAEACLRSFRPQAVIPIPLHKDKLRQRHFNQAEEIARPAAALLGVPLLSDALIRAERTGAMKELSAAQRAENLRGAFKAGRRSFSFSRALLVDDIYTTGATVDAAARVLREAGVREIYFMSVCIGAGFMVDY